MACSSKQELTFVTFVAVYSWKRASQVRFSLLIDYSCQRSLQAFSLQSDPRYLAWQTSLLVSSEPWSRKRQNNKKKKKSVGRGKHYSPPQWLHPYHQACGQNVFWWPKDHFRSIRVYNLTASRLDSLSVCKYCTDTGRHLPPSARETEMPACRPSVRPRGLSLLPGTLANPHLLLNDSSYHTTATEKCYTWEAHASFGWFKQQTLTIPTSNYIQ